MSATGTGPDTQTLITAKSHNPRDLLCRLPRAHWRSHWELSFAWARILGVLLASLSPVSGTLHGPELALEIPVTESIIPRIPLTVTGLLPVPPCQEPAPSPGLCAWPPLPECSPRTLEWAPPFRHPAATSVSLTPGTFLSHLFLSISFNYFLTQHLYCIFLYHLSFA